MNWINVNDRLPDNIGRYLAVVNGKTTMLYYDPEMNLWYEEDTEYSTEGVSHWALLPEPPKD